MDSLTEIEKIKKLKSRYFRFLDSKNWEGLASCLSESVVFTAPKQGIYMEGKDAVMQGFSSPHAETKTAHTGSMPEISFSDEANAKGIWFMSDIVITESEGKGEIKKGYGRYHETYIKTGTEWKIQHIELERLFFE